MTEEPFEGAAESAEEFIASEGALQAARGRFLDAYASFDGWLGQAIIVHLAVGAERATTSAGSS
jgi:hypothetical protein